MIAKTTPHTIVLPFYGYAAVSLCVAMSLLCLSVQAFTGHYFHPHILAVTHSMALGWGTMMILGASYQLMPVITESDLFSETLAYVSFFAAAAGIPLLVYAFYVFDMGIPAQAGAILINVSVACYVINQVGSYTRSRHQNMHGLFMVAAACWLLLTTLVGLLLVFNFSNNVLSKDSLYYLSLHAHMGIAGWFLLMIVGVGTRLIPMFLLSKYESAHLLKIIYWFINASLIAFVILFLGQAPPDWYFVPLTGLLTAILQFGYYCRRAYQERIRKTTDTPVKISLLSIVMTFLPVLLLLSLLAAPGVSSGKLALFKAYGFVIFFGWITTLILGMTFKTLPFIIWNKRRYDAVVSDKKQGPGNLYSHKWFAAMALVYMTGFSVFLTGIFTEQIPFLQTGSVLLLIASLLFNLNVAKLFMHQPVHT
jgi:hypothetical protein